MQGAGLCDCAITQSGRRNSSLNPSLAVDKLQSSANQQATEPLTPAQGRSGTPIAPLQSPGRPLLKGGALRARYTAQAPALHVPGEKKMSAYPQQADPTKARLLNLKTGTTAIINRSATTIGRSPENDVM